MKSSSLATQQQLLESHPETGTAQKVTPAAHPLYPSHQVFLWLPGLASGELPFCSCNRAAPEIAVLDGIFGIENLHDDEGNLHAPPFPVSHCTYISWHTHVTPPVSFHPVPIKRFLSIAEMEDLAHKVLEVSGEKLPGNAHLLSILRNEHKSLILCFLARLGLLECLSSHRK